MAKQFWKPSVVLTMETRATDTSFWTTSIQTLLPHNQRTVWKKPNGLIHYDSESAQFLHCDRICLEITQYLEHFHANTICYSEAGTPWRVGLLNRRYSKSHTSQSLAAHGRNISSLFRRDLAVTAAPTQLTSSCRNIGTSVGLWKSHTHCLTAAFQTKSSENGWKQWDS